MAYNFPDSPTVNQVFQKWTWNGEAWVLTTPTTTASSIPFTPAGDIVATNVQAAIVEVDAEMHAADAALTTAVGTAQTAADNANANANNRVVRSGDTMTGQLTVNNGVIMSAITPTTGTFHFGTSGNKYLTHDGTSYVLNGGPFYVNGMISSAVPTGSMHLRLYENTGGWQKYIRCVNGGNLNIVNSANSQIIMDLTDGGSMSIPGNFSATGGVVYVYSAPGGNAHVWMADENGTTKGIYFWDRGSNSTRFRCPGGSDTINRSDGSWELNIGFRGRQGMSGAGGGSIHNFWWTTTAIQAWIDASNIGNVSISSDYRVKKDVVDLPPMWDTVKALRPIRYTQAEFSPPSHVDFIAEKTKAKAEAKDTDEQVEIPGPLFTADDIERWGFIAHELQDTLTPSAATGEKDSYDTVQSPNPFTVIAALTRALQEAMARIEALEAKIV